MRTVSAQQCQLDSVSSKRAWRITYSRPVDVPVAVWIRAKAVFATTWGHELASRMRLKVGGVARPRLAPSPCSQRKWPQYQHLPRVHTAIFSMLPSRGSRKLSLSHPNKNPSTFMTGIKSNSVRNQDTCFVSGRSYSAFSATTIRSWAKTELHTVVVGDARERWVDAIGGDESLDKIYHPHGSDPLAGVVAAVHDE